MYDIIAKWATSTSSLLEQELPRRLNGHAISIGVLVLELAVVLGV
jgi:hypothetical protein